jgi:hypothetical protein
VLIVIVLLTLAYGLHAAHDARYGVSAPRAASGAPRR